MDKKTNTFIQVQKIVAQIPKGKVATYGSIAQRAGIKDVRIVVWSIHKNKDPLNLPCHRIIKADGSLASGYGMGGPEEQRARLEAEGIVFDLKGKVDLKKYLWSE